MIFLTHGCNLNPLKWPQKSPLVPTVLRGNEESSGSAVSHGRCELWGNLFDLIAGEIQSLMWFEKVKNRLLQNREIVVMIFIAMLGGVWSIFEYFNPSQNTVSSQAESSAPNSGMVINGDATSPIVHSGSGDINIGISLEQYEQGLRRREEEITLALTRSFDADRGILLREKAGIEKQLWDIRTSYESTIADLRKRIEQLETIRGQVSDELLDDALSALSEGDRAKADQIFSQIEVESQGVIDAAAEAAYQRSRIALEAIRYGEGFKHAQRSIQLSPENALYLGGAGELARLVGGHDLELTYRKQALTIDLETFGEDHPRVAMHRNNLGSAWESKGEYDLAIEYYELALASNLKTFGEEHPHVARDRNNLGLAWKSKGEYDRAIEYYELALDSDLKTFGEEHPRVAIRRNNLGSAWDSKGEYDRAIEYFELALDSDLETFSEDHPNVARVRNNLGGAWDSKGEYDRAIEYYELALDSNLKTFGEDHPHVAIDRNNLGGAWDSKGEYDRAIEYYELALASDLKTFGEVHPKVAIRHNNLGLAWNSKGEYDRAIEYYEQALLIFTEYLGSTHPSTTTVSTNLDLARQAKSAIKE
ncbi:MAG: tetratricopeptide repeat protein [Gammaproteobacteria bacterium]|nr:tetratricopeptide repeat protein [Gammaproteobacteria bacterium]